MPPKGTDPRRDSDERTRIIMIQESEKSHVDASSVRLLHHVGGLGSLEAPLHRCTLLLECTSYPIAMCTCVPRHAMPIHQCTAAPLHCQSTGAASRMPRCTAVSHVAQRRCATRRAAAQLHYPNALYSMLHARNAGLTATRPCCRCCRRRRRRRRQHGRPGRAQVAAPRQF